MRYLLDTHAILWWRQDDPRLPHRIDAVLQSPENEILFSQVSLWEIAIKRSLGRLKLEGSLEEFVDGLRNEQGFIMLPLEVSHFTRLESLPHHHGDPFDRLLIAQAMETGAIAVTDDAAWKKYRVKTRW